MKKKPWWKFYHPDSGVPGGVLFGTIIGVLILVIRHLFFK